MDSTERDIRPAEDRMAALRDASHAVSARYDRRSGRVVVALHTGVHLTVPARLIEGLAGASPDDLATVEVSPAGLGLHWPKLDADVYLPALLRGLFGSERWMGRPDGERVGGSAPQRDEVGTETVPRTAQD